MSINSHILSSSKDLKPFAMELKSITKSVEVLIKKVMPVDNIDVVYYINPEGTIKEIGHGGYTPCANSVFISLDPKNSKFKYGMKKELSFTLAHEINHAIRFRTPISKEALFEAMISEGLADHFAMEVTGRKSPPMWSVALTDKQKKIWLKKAVTEYNSARFDRESWFFGSITKKVPRWTAYTLGFDIVATYLQKHPKISASELISAKASVFKT